MSDRVVRLPTASLSYIRIRRAGKAWSVDLVTPCDGGKSIATALCRSSSLEAAVEYAKATGLRIHRPVRLPREARS
jgi:hypothetical protein